MLEIRLMGAFSASLHADGLVHEIALHRRSSELLAFLAMSRGRYLHRTELVQALASNGAPDLTPEAVSTALWRLRRALETLPARRGDFLTTNQYGAVGLCGASDWSLDVTAFEKLAGAGLRSCGCLNESRADALRTAQRAYKDCLLPGFTSGWVLRERERLRRTYMDVSFRLMQLEAAEGNFAGAIRSAQRILESDEVREDVHRELMRYFMLHGQRSQALRQFEQCREILKRELAIAPMPETLALYRTINDAGAIPSIPATPRGAAEHLQAARAHITQADSCLRHSIELINRQ